MSITCINHPDQSAVEHCEVCAEPLCGYCLWYGQDGMRMCERHARARQADGTQVYAPAHFAGAIEGSHAGLERAISREAKPTWSGNQTDLLALVAATAGITSVLFMMGLAYCVPVATGVVGLVAWISSSQAVDERRTRRLSMVGMGGAAFYAALVVLIAMLCCAGALVPVLTEVLASGGP